MPLAHVWDFAVNIGLVNEYFPPFTPGGAEWSMLFLAQRLAESHHIVVITPNYGSDPYAKEGNLTIDRFAMPFRMPPGQQILPYGRLANPLFYAYSAMQIARRVRRHGLDILHAQNKQSIVGTLWAGRLASLPVAVTLRDLTVLCRYGMCLNDFDTTPHGCDWSSYKKCLSDYLTLCMPGISKPRRAAIRAMSIYHRLDSLLKLAVLQQADAVIAVSEKMRRIYISRGLDPRHAHVIYNPLPELPRQRPAPLRSPDRIHILYAGNLWWGKGPQLLIEALPTIVRAFPERSLAVALAGQGPLQGPLEQRIRELGLERLVCFKGQVQRDELDVLMAEADVVVVPSIVQEPFGRVALEALMAGTPVVVASRGGLPEIVEDGITGIVVHPDPQQIADAVSKVLRTPAFRRNVVNARDELQRKFGSDVAGRHAQLYAQLLGKRGRQDRV